jgi:ubiquinone/menaquinone biosynthesis C-methylase UbiE
MTRSDEPTLAELWEQQAEAWAAFAQGGDPATAFHLERFLELLPPPGTATLDLGCGEGRIGRVLASRGHRVTGVDSSPTLARLAQEGGGFERVVEANAAHLPFGERSFDLVMAFMSLQDVDDMPAAISDVARVLVPGGAFALALTHPIATAGDFLDDKVFALDRPYGEPSRFTWHREAATGEPLAIHGEHRPLEAYTRALEDAGFVIEALREPVPSARFLTEHSDYAFLARVPYFLHLRARRS